jgi:hypothetical protein
MCVLFESCQKSKVRRPNSKVESPMFNVQCSKVDCRTSSTLDFGRWTLDFLISLMMNVHRLDTYASWSSHARKVHTRAAEETGG